MSELPVTARWLLGTDASAHWANQYSSNQKVACTLNPWCFFYNLARTGTCCWQNGMLPALKLGSHRQGRVKQKGEVVGRQNVAVK